MDSTMSLATSVIALISFLTFMIAYGEYRRQSKQKRSENLQAMRKRYDGFQDLCALLEREKSECGRKEALVGLEKMSFQEKRSFLAFYEEIALMMNSGLIKRKIVHYMFGYYAIRCWESEIFWNNINRESAYWSLFKSFVEKMKKRENSFLQRHLTGSSRSVRDFGI